MSFLARFKSLDLYRDVPKDLTEPTLSGATVSISCVALMMILFLTEFSTYLTTQTVSEMYVEAPRDSVHEHAMIQINMNITVPKMPCAVVSVDAQDVMGSHVMDVGGALHKVRLAADGSLKLDSNGKPAAIDHSNPKEELGEGCRVEGNMIVKKVPGNFHVSCHAHADLLTALLGSKQMDVSHTVHHLSFGEETDALMDALASSGVVEGAQDVGEGEPITNPLEGAQKVVEKEGTSYEYYIKVVPTTYETLRAETFHSYQFVANSNEIQGRYRLPAIYFRYDMSPITVKFTQKKEAFSHFLVQICAIIGGLFTVMGLFNSVVNTSIKKLIKKAQIGKLG